MNETWKPIPGFDGYEVSDHGRVRSWRCGGQGGLSKRREVPRLMTPVLHPGGYLGVCLRTFEPSDQCKIVRRNVHVLVMLAFVGQRPDGMQIAHFDGDKTNNILHNLRYASTFENAADSERQGVRPKGERHGRSKLTASQVLQIRDLVLCGFTQDELAASYGVSPSAIGLIVRREKWAHL